MTTTLTRTATPDGLDQHVDLDARLAIVDAGMDALLDEAAVAFEVNTAHIEGAPAPVVDVAVIPAVAPAPRLTPYRTPIAACLYRAHLRLTESGWCAGRLRDEQGARCLIGVIRAEAGSSAEADEACVFLLDIIQREFDPNAATIPSWNDNQADPRAAMRVLGRSADLADAQGV